MDKCENHEALYQDHNQLRDMVRDSLAWQGRFEALMESMMSQMKETQALHRDTQREQREMKKCLNELAKKLAGHYVTRSEFHSYCETAEKRAVRLHHRLDEFNREQKANLWKIIGMVFPAGALMFAIVQWLVNVAS